MVADIQGGTAFNTAAVEYLDETSAESFKDPENGHVTAAMGTPFPPTSRTGLPTVSARRET